MRFHSACETALYRVVKRHFMLALVLTFCMWPLQGATLERLSLDDMIAKSTAIVRGKVTGPRTQRFRSGYLHVLHDPSLGDV